MTLYNLKSADGDWRITKFTNELDPEGSYLVSADACTCPAGVRPTCRHRQMLPKFLAAEAEDSGMFFHFETEQFLTPDLGESNSSSDFGEADDSPELSGLQEEQILMGFHNEVEPRSGLSRNDSGLLATITPDVGGRATPYESASLPNSNVANPTSGVSIHPTGVTIRRRL